MSELIRMLGMHLSHNGTCRKCGLKRDAANHHKCDRWPTSMGCARGFRYTSNSQESLADLKHVVEAIRAGSSDATPVRFEIKIMQVAGPDEKEVR